MSAMRQLKRQTDEIHLATGCTTMAGATSSANCASSCRHLRLLGEQVPSRASHASMFSYCASVAGSPEGSSATGSDQPMSCSAS